MFTKLGTSNLEERLGTARSGRSLHVPRSSYFGMRKNCNLFVAKESSLIRFSRRKTHRETTKSIGSRYDLKSQPGDGVEPSYFFFPAALALAPSCITNCTALNIS